ncbi:MAG: carboxymuconolactone decarboxylase family protein, partial [Sphaerochaetaceae bacterium]|nr:carboxymuconolactone decarboxylase family protein [Sphaerochaetaceae bacterium]
MDKTQTNRRRIQYTEVAPEGTGFLSGLEKYIESTTLEPLLVELVKIRASQINGCAFCIDMHTKDARDKGESEQRLYAVSTWREAPYYSPRERAAIEWSE